MTTWTDNESGGTIWINGSEPVTTWTDNETGGNVYSEEEGSISTIDFLQSGSDAITWNLQDRDRQTVWLTDFMSESDRAEFADNSSIPDIAAAIASAVTRLTAGNAAGGILRVPTGSGKLGSQVTIADNSYVDIVGEGYSTVIQKGFNGDMISLGQGCRIRDIRLQGAGGSYTGRGVVISSGSQGIGSARFISDSWILDTESYGVEFTQAVAGYSSVIHNTKIIPTSLTTAAVKYPDDAGGGGNRTLSLVWTGSNPIVDLASSDNSQVVGCQGSGPIFSATTLKAVITGCRIPSNSGASWTIDGNSTVVVGNTMAPGTLVFASTLVLCKFKGNALAAGTTITDNAPGVASSKFNEIDINYTLYTPTWSTSGTQPAIGNGTLTAAWSRAGTRAKVNITLTVGSTTTFGNASWSFSSPYTATRTSLGDAFFLDSGTAQYGGGSAYIGSGTAVIKVSPPGSAVDYIGATIPFTWAVNDQLNIEIEFDIN